MPGSVRRRSNKRVRVKRVNKNRSRRLGRRSSSKKVNRSRSRGRRRRRTMRGGSESSGLYGAEKFQKHINELRKAQAKLKEEERLAREKANLEEEQNQTNQEEIPDKTIDTSSMSLQERLALFQ